MLMNVGVSQKGADMSENNERCCAFSCVRTPKRNQAIELLRFFLMIGVVFMHSVGFSSSTNRWHSHIADSCVTCFVFISGYYGIRWKANKAYALLAIGAWCALISTFVGFCFDGYVSVLDFLIVWKDCFRTYWFLWAYMVLMLVSPILNEIKFPVYAGDANNYCRNVKKNGGGGLLFIVFIWAFAVYFQGRFKVVPNPSVFSTHSPLALIGIYTAARMFVASKIESRIRLRHLIVAMGICIPLCTWKFSPYVSPISVVLAASVFVFVKNYIRIDEGRCAKYIAWIAPSVFPIYLIHQSPAGLKCLENLNVVFEQYQIGDIVLLLSAIIIAVGCVILDVVFRRIPLAALNLALACWK